MPRLSFPITVKHTGAPVSGSEVILNRSKLPTGTPKIDAVAGHARFSFIDSSIQYEGQLSIVATREPVKLSRLSQGTHGMHIVYAVGDPDTGEVQQSWVAFDAVATAKPVYPEHSAPLLSALSERYGALVDMKLSDITFPFGRFQIESPDIHQDNVLQAARLAIRGFADFTALQ